VALNWVGPASGGPRRPRRGLLVDLVLLEGLSCEAKPQGRRPGPRSPLSVDLPEMADGEHEHQ
jgi:hypothetical protein